MPTIYYNQIRSAQEAELESNKIAIKTLKLQVEVLSRLLNQLKNKWEKLDDEHKELQQKWNHLNK